MPSEVKEKNSQHRKRQSPLTVKHEKTGVSKNQKTKVPEKEAKALSDVKKTKISSPTPRGEESKRGTVARPRSAGQKHTEGSKGHLTQRSKQKQTLTSVSIPETAEHKNKSAHKSWFQRLFS